MRLGLSFLEVGLIKNELTKKPRQKEINVFEIGFLIIDMKNKYSCYNYNVVITHNYFMTKIIFLLPVLMQLFGINFTHIDVPVKFCWLHKKICFNYCF